MGEPSSHEGLVPVRQRAMVDMMFNLGAKRFKGFLSTRSFMDSLPGHLMPDLASQDRLPMLLERIEAIVLTNGH